MNKINFLLVLVLLLQSIHADQFDDALKDIQKSLDDNHEVYENGMNQAHESRVQNFFYDRDNSLRVILQSIHETSMKRVLFQENLMSNLREDSSTNMKEALNYAFIVKESLQETKRELSRGLTNIDKLKKSSTLDCEDDFNTKVDEKLDPTTIYPIPTIEETDAGYPRYNLTFAMNMSYNMGSNQMSYSVGQPVVQETDDPTKDAIVIGGAAVIQGVVCFFSAMAVCQGYVFMLSAAVLSFVYDLVGSLMHNNAAQRFRRNVRHAFNEANKNIEQVHIDLKNKNPALIKNLCTSVDKKEIESNIFNHRNTQMKLLSKTQKYIQENDMLIDNYSRSLENDRELLVKMFGEKKELLLKKYKSSLEEARNIYAQNGQKIFDFYTFELFPLFQKTKDVEAMDRLKMRQHILAKVVEGNVMFGENFTWKALKKNLADRGVL